MPIDVRRKALAARDVGCKLVKEEKREPSTTCRACTRHMAVSLVAVHSVSSCVSLQDEPHRLQGPHASSMSMMKRSRFSPPPRLHKPKLIEKCLTAPCEQRAACIAGAATAATYQENGGGNICISQSTRFIGASSSAKQTVGSRPHTMQQPFHGLKPRQDAVAPTSDNRRLRKDTWIQAAATLTEATFNLTPAARKRNSQRGSSAQTSFEHNTPLPHHGGGWVSTQYVHVWGPTR